MSQNSSFSLKQIFPYEAPNIYQSEIINQDLSDSKHVIIEAPVGSGKTAAVLTLAIKTAINNNLRGIIVLTRTHNQMKNFLKELALINKKFYVPYLAFIGKSNLCRFKTDPIATELIKFQGGCNAYACPYKEKYDKLNNKLIFLRKIWEQKKFYFNRVSSLKEHTTILEEIEEWCPYYLQKELLRFVRVIVTTYANGTKSMLESMEKVIGSSISDFIIIVDEAHNFSIPEKIDLPLEWVNKGLSLVKKDDLLNLLKSSNEVWGSEIEFFLKDAINSIDIFIQEKFSSKNRDIPPFIYETKMFLDTWLEGIATIKGNIAVSIIPEIKKKFDSLNHASKLILLSATISPFKTYSAVFGFNKPKLLKIKDKHGSKRVFYCLKNPGITSRFLERNAFSYRKMSQIIEALGEVSSKKALVIAPSYDYASELSKYLSPLYVETRDTSIEDIKKVVLSESSNKLILAVNSGKLLEGFDLVFNKGSVFDLVIFSGLPFPPPSWEKKVMRSFLSKKFSKELSISLTEQLPVIRTLIQALGRTTRNSMDKGIGIILDYRINWLSKFIPINVFQDLETLIFNIKRFFS